MKKETLIASALSLVIGFGIGAQSLGTAQAEETVGSPTAPQGDLLKVCIDKKTGVLRAAGTCKTTEKPYVLGGPGPRGPEGPVGQTGATGPQGERGLTGEAGSVAGLKTKSLKLWDMNLSKTCGESMLTGTTRIFEAMNPNALTSTRAGLTFTKTCSTMFATDVTVYAP